MNSQLAFCTPLLPTPRPLTNNRYRVVCSHPKPQGPHCRLVDTQILRHCLSCANKRPTVENPQPLLHAARSALPKQRGLAERFFLKALAADPTYTRTYLLYALQVQRRDPSLARELFTKGVRVDPSDAQLLQAWGLFESKQGKMDRAQRLLKRSVELEPRNRPVLRWKIIFGYD